MKNESNRKNTEKERANPLLLAAIAGVIGAASAPSHAADKREGSTTSGTNVECYGVNRCKGMGACGGPGHSCAGQNACKGKGWISMDKQTCLKLAGSSLKPVQDAEAESADKKQTSKN